MSLLTSALFLVLAPGTVAILVPWLITRWRPGSAPAGLDDIRVAGFALAVVGGVVLLDAFGRFAWIGRGSPAPVLPTETLVVSGLYRHVRNPMYVAVMAAVAGQALFFWRVELLWYLLLLYPLFDSFVRLYEEPTLRARYGSEYGRYCRHVRRWIPRLKPWDAEGGRSRYGSFLG